MRNAARGLGGLGVCVLLGAAATAFAQGAPAPLLRGWQAVSEPTGPSYAMPPGWRRVAPTNPAMLARWQGPTSNTDAQPIFYLERRPNNVATASIGTLAAQIATVLRQNRVVVVVQRVIGDAVGREWAEIESVRPASATQESVHMIMRMSLVDRGANGVVANCGAPEQAFGGYRAACEGILASVRLR